MNHEDSRIWLNSHSGRNVYRQASESPAKVVLQTFTGLSATCKQAFLFPGTGYLLHQTNSFISP